MSKYLLLDYNEGESFDILLRMDFNWKSIFLWRFERTSAKFLEAQTERV